MRNILLVDCNNFFASCELLDHPELRGKPVCVLSNNDACVVARTNEAKELGIPMGMPYFIAKKKFKNAVYISGDKKKYSAISKKIMAKLSNYTPNVEKYSIDEAFLDITGTERLYKMAPVQVADKIRREIKEEIGIEVSIGVSKTKTLAKIASEIAKSKSWHHQKTDYEGVFEISNVNLNVILSNTPIEEIWGIGRNLHKFFRKHNIRNAFAYANLSDDFLKRNLGKRGLDLKKELTGNIAIPFADYYVAPKSISRTSSFKEFTNDKDFILNELNSHLHEVCAKLREHKLQAGAVVIMLRRKDFKREYQKVVFNIPKESEFELYKIMHEIFEKMYKKEVIYRSSGVIAFKLTDRKNSQMCLFEDDTAKRKRKLSSAWDKTEQKFGYGAISLGVEQAAGLTQKD